MSAIDDLAAELAKLPGIGRKTALRLTYHLLKQPPEQSRKLAATTRSSSISMSFGSTTAGSILSARIVPFPSAVAVTIPPPLDAVTVRFSSSSCIACKRP